MKENRGWVVPSGPYLCSSESVVGGQQLDRCCKQAITLKTPSKVDESITSSGAQTAPARQTLSLSAIIF
jgi:hypothetical protein